MNERFEPTKQKYNNYYYCQFLVYNSRFLLQVNFMQLVAEMVQVVSEQLNAMIRTPTNGRLAPQWLGVAVELA